MSTRFWIICFYMVPSLLQAQVFSKEGRFSVPFAKGCAPFRINVSEHDTFGNITRQYFYEEGASESIDKTYAYDTPGIYKIVQIVGIDVVPKTDTLTIEVFEPTPPSFLIEKCNATGITIASTETIYDFLRVYFTPDDSATLNPGEQTSFNYPSATEQTFSIKGFYKDAQENCSSLSRTVIPLNNLSTPTIITASIKETCQGFYTMALDLGPSDPDIRYEVVLTQNNARVIYSGFIKNNRLNIADIPVQSIPAPYCVRVNAIDACTTTTLEGQDFCADITPTSLSAFENIHSSYDGTGIFIYLDTISTGNLLVYRQLEEGGFTFRNTVKHSFTDPIGSIARRYSYRIDYLDTCGQVLHQGNTHPPFLRSNRLNDNLYLIEYTPPENTIESNANTFYLLGGPPTISSNIINETFEINLGPDQGIRQILQSHVEYTTGLRLSSNSLTLKYAPIIHVPTAFTPNVDGINDTLKFFGLPSSSATVSIYTRWGQLIYSSDRPVLGWDGRINGDFAPEGAYLYEIIFHTQEGEMIRQKGTFVLLKK